MPKKILDAFFSSMVRDIKNHYQSGDKYLSIREIAEQYQVSVQTAQRGVKRLEEYGYISVKQKAGITVETLRPTKKLAGYKIAVVSARPDARFNDAFFKGIRETAEAQGVSARLVEMPDINLRSLKFGEYLLSLDADGIIALYCRDSILPFYHVLQGGLDIVSDIIFDELPILTAVQTDNYHHSQEAGRIFREQGYRRLLVVGYYPPKGYRRLEGLVDTIKDHCEDVQYVRLTDMGAMHAIDSFLNKFNSHCAVYSIDHSANYIVGAKFIQHNITVKDDNFLVYDCEDDDYFSYHGLNPVKRVGRSFNFLGTELCKVLIARRETGAYPLPLQRKI